MSASGIVPAAVGLYAFARGFRFVRNGLALATFLVVVGCSRSTDPNSAAKSAPAHTSSRPFLVGMNRVLRPAEVNLKLFQQHALWLSADGETLHASVVLVNRGDVTLSSQGKFPVMVVVRLLGSAGKIVDDQLVVAHLPNPLPPDNSEAIEVEIPAAALADHRVALLAMQKGTGGFDQWGMKVLGLGPFWRCDPPGPREDTLCQEPDDPLLQVADEPSIPHGE